MGTSIQCTYYQDWMKVCVETAELPFFELKGCSNVSVSLEAAFRVSAADECGSSQIMAEQKLHDARGQFLWTAVCKTCTSDSCQMETIVKCVARHGGRRHPHSWPEWFRDLTVSMECRDGA